MPWQWMQRSSNMKKRRRSVVWPKLKLMRRQNWWSKQVKLMTPTSDKWVRVDAPIIENWRKSLRLQMSWLKYWMPEIPKDAVIKKLSNKLYHRARKYCWYWIRLIWFLHRMLVSGRDTWGETSLVFHSRLHSRIRMLILLLGQLCTRNQWLKSLRWSQRWHLLPLRLGWRTFSMSLRTIVESMERKMPSSSSQLVSLASQMLASPL